MRRFFRDINPTVRGFLVIGLIALAVVVLNLYGTLAALGILLRVAFFLAVAFFVYLLWRERRDEIGMWSTRERIVFYGAALLIVVALGSYFWRGLPGYDVLGFLGVLGCSGFSMVRVWRDRHSWS
jgi:hypothetical protein